MSSGATRRSTPATSTESVIIVRGSTSRAISIRGIVPEAERTITDIAENVSQGNLDTLSQNEIFLGKDLADELNANLGNRIALVTPWGNRNYKVAGLIDSGNYLADLGTMQGELAQVEARLVEMSSLVERASASLTVKGIDLKPADVPLSTMAMYEKTLSSGVASPLLPSSKNGCAAEPPIAVRSPTTVMPLLAGSLPGVTATVSRVLAPRTTENGLALPSPVGSVGAPTQGVALFCGLLGLISAKSAALSSVSWPPPAAPVLGYSSMAA